MNTEATAEATVQTTEMETGTDAGLYLVEILKTLKAIELSSSNTERIVARMHRDLSWCCELAKVAWLFLAFLAVFEFIRWVFC